MTSAPARGTATAGVEPLYGMTTSNDRVPERSRNDERTTIVSMRAYDWYATPLTVSVTESGITPSRTANAVAIPVAAGTHRQRHVLHPRRRRTR